MSEQRLGGAGTVASARSHGGHDAATALRHHPVPRAHAVPDLPEQPVAEETVIHVCPETADLIEPYLSLLKLSGYAVQRANVNVAASCPRRRFLVVPAVTATQSARIAQLSRSRLWSTIVAVVCDPDGSQTVRARDAGAHCVLNTLIDPWLWIRQFDAAWGAMSAVAPAPAHPQEADSSARALAADDFELLEKLRGPLSVAALARAYFISERSMYRRLRELYDALGVTTRAQALEAAAALSLRASPVL